MDISSCRNQRQRFIGGRSRNLGQRFPCFFRPLSTGQGNYIGDLLPQLRGQQRHMCGSLRENQGVAAVLKAPPDVLGNALISCLIHGNGRVESLNRRVLPFRFERRPEARQSGNDIKVKGPLFRLLSGVHSITDRPAMHEDDGMVAVLPYRGWPSSHTRFSRERF